MKSYVCAVLAVSFSLWGAAAGTASAQEQAPQPSEKPAPEKAMTAQERLDACAKKYAAAKTYRDEGTVVSEFKVPGTDQKVANTMPIRTAFERGGRLYWEFRGSATPGKKADQTYAVWSTDQKSFSSYWTLTRQTSSFGDLMMALAGPTGVSSGSALAIIPLLRPDALGAHTITNITEPVDKGTDKVDGQACTRIEGKNRAGPVTLWIDNDLAVRKIVQIMEVDPSKVPARAGQNMDKFTTTTTMTFKPAFDGQIENDRFSPPAEAK